MRVIPTLAFAACVVVPVAAQPFGQLPVAQPVSTLDAQIAAQEEQLRRATEDKARLEVELQELASRSESAKEELHRRARALYRMRRAGMLPIAGGFDALLAHLSRLERLERMVRGDLSALQFLRARRQALRGEVARKEEEAANARRTIEELRRQKEAMQQRLWAQQGYGGAFGPSYAPRLPPMVGPTGAAPAVGAYGLTVRGESQGGAGFEGRRGRLRLPVAGGAIREAQREDGRGLEFVSPGAAVVAAADGRVVFSQRYGAYGTLVILDHGDDYYTLYGGLAQTPLVPGEWVGEGARIGSIGSQPLFFEVRQGTRNLDARRWVGL